MSIYADLSKLGRVKLPSGTTYALVDIDGRAIIAPDFSASSAYAVGDHVIYGDNLYRAKVNVTAGEWSASDWGLVTVSSEIKRLEGIISGGVHYSGKTTTPLYDGATTNPISIGGSSYTADSGSLVILDLASVATAYKSGIAYDIHSYIVNSGIHYITNAAITAAENTSISAISSKLDAITSDPEFIFDGSSWAALGSIADGLGDLAFKDTASGSYVKPTGSGSVTIKTYAPTTKYLARTTITGTNGTVNATQVTGGSTKDIAKVGTAVRYGTADVGTAVTYGNADVGTSVVYGNADVGTAVTVGTALSGTKTFNTDAIKSASLTGTKTFNTDAIKSAALTGTTTFATAGTTATVDGDCLTFTAASTANVGISTTPASTATVGISTTAASTATVGLTTTDITPATSADTTRTLTPAVASTKTLTPAIAAPNTQTITPAESNGTLTGSYTLTQTTAAKVASSAVTVATGALSDTADGASLVSAVTAGTESATVTVGTVSDTITVK